MALRVEPPFNYLPLLLADEEGEVTEGFIDTGGDFLQLTHNLQCLSL